jgi:hypothetical protein
MGRRDEIDVVRALGLQAQHGAGQVRRRHGGDVGGGKLLTDLVILTKYTTEIATSKKNSPRTSAAGDGWFFPVVQPNVSDQGLTGNSAKSNLPGQSVDPAVARATTAIS